MKLEKSYYNLIKQFLEGKFKEIYGNCYLEVTSQRFSEKIKEAIPRDADIIFSFLSTSKPDITGFIKMREGVRIESIPLGEESGSYLDTDDKKSLEWTEFIIVEVKYDEIKLKDIYQTKRYADLFRATYSFLLSYKSIPEKIKRLSLMTNILRTSHFPISPPTNRVLQAFFEMGYSDLILGQYSVDSIKDPKSCIISEDTWFPQDPFYYLH